MYLYIAKLYNRERARPDCKVKRYAVILLLHIKDDIALQPSCVANMTPFAIISSLTLVIHDNMIDGTNHIV
jgi:hypothetical protein